MSFTLLFFTSSSSSDEHFGAKARSQIGGHVWRLCKIWDTFLFLLLFTLHRVGLWSVGWVGAFNAFQLSDLFTR